MATGTKTKPSAKLLRREAKALGVSGWEDMSLSELEAAVEAASGKARKAAKKDKGRKPSEEALAESTKSATATKAAKKASKPAKASKKSDDDDDEVAENGNPYRPDSNLHAIAEELIRGGKRKDMVKRLKKKIELAPRQRAGADYDVDYEIDRRLLIVGQLLRKDHGFEVERGGRGPADATIKATPPA